MSAATNVQAKKKAGSTVREHLPGLLKTRAIMQLITQSSNLTQQPARWMCNNVKINA